MRIKGKRKMRKKLIKEHRVKFHVPLNEEQMEELYREMDLSDRTKASIGRIAILEYIERKKTEREQISKS